MDMSTSVHACLDTVLTSRVNVACAEESTAKRTGKEESQNTTVPNKT